MYEIERRFLVPLDMARVQAAISTPIAIEQAYLTQTGKWQVRSRKTTEGEFITYVMTLKRRTSLGEAIEIEEPTSAAMHGQIVTITGTVLKKGRTHHSLPCGHTLELDIFEDATLLPGYAIAEVEVGRLNQHIDLPDWIGPEITGKSGYSNAKLFQKLLDRN